MKDYLKDLKIPRTTLDGIYRGVVENNVDEKEAGRCQIRVFGVHTDEKFKVNDNGIPTEELPWAEPATPIYGGVSNVGVYGVPCQGAHVFLFFEAGNPMAPRYFATAPGIPYVKNNPDKGFNDPDGEYPKTDKLRRPDWSKGKSSTSIYPNSYVTETRCGHIVEMDDTPGSERIIIKHGKTGATIEFTPEGSIKIDSKSNTNKESSGSKETFITGKYTINVSDKYRLITGNKIIQTNGIYTHSISGSKNEYVGGVLTQKAGEKSVNTGSNHNTVAGGKNNMIAGKSILIKSKEDNIKVEAPLNIDIEAGVAAKMEGTATADVKSLLSTVEGTVMVKTKGLIAQHEGTLLYNSKGLIQIHQATGLNWVKGKMIMLGG